MMIVKTLSFALLLITCISLSATTLADNDAPTVKPKKTLDISVGDWPPFIASEQRHNGFIAHLISDIFAAEGYTVNYQFLPWNRAYREAAVAERDATAVWMHQSEREADFYYSDPVLNETFVFFHRVDQPFDWQSLEDLEGMTLGGGMSYSYGPAFDDALAEGIFNIQRVASTRQNFLRLLYGRIDAFAEEIHVGYYTLKQELSQEQIEQITHHPKPLLRNQSYVLFPRASEDSKLLIEKFNERLRKFRESGRYQEYFDDFKRGEYDLSDQSG